MASSAFDKLNDPPEDAISSLVYHPLEPSVLLAASWDKTARVYDTSANRLETKVIHAAPVLDACFVGADGAKAASVGVDRGVRIFNVTTGKGNVIGKVDAPIRNVKYCQAGCIVTGSWDKTVRLFDHRSGDSVGLFRQPDKVFALDVSPPSENTYYVVVAMAGRKVFLYDLRNMSVACQRRDSSLKFQTRTLRCMPNGVGYAMSSIEGRIAIEYFDYSRESQLRKYAFKCHRETVDGVQIVYPVNALAFNPVHGTFASGGADGLVNIWDSVNRRRIRQFRKFETGVSAVALNCSGEQIAVGCSYTWEQGDKTHLPDAIYFRNADTRPRKYPPA